MLKSQIKAFKEVKERSRKTKKIFPFFMLYLACLSVTEISIRDIISSLSKAENIFTHISQTFKKIEILINKWGYEQLKACKVVMSQVKEPNLRSFLSRFSQAISINMSIQEFARIEYEKYIFTFDNEYNRTMDKLKTLSDAYSAILTSIAFISISLTLTLLIFSSSTLSSLLYLIFLIIVVILTAFILLIYLASPPEEIIQTLNGGYFKNTLQYLKLFLPFFIILFFTFFLNNISFFNFSLTPPLFSILVGLPLLILATRGIKLINKIKDMENNLPLFIKTLGKAAAISGSLSSGIKRIMYNDYGSLNDLIKKVYYRIKLGVSLKYAFETMVKESKSELIRLVLLIFYESINKVGKYSEISYLCFDFSNNWLIRRKKREQIFSYLKGLLIPLQITIVSVLTLTQSIANLLIKFFGTMGNRVIFIVEINPEFLNIFFFCISLMLTLVNALSLWIVKGDSKFTFQFYLGIFLIINGIVIFSIDFLINSYLQNLFPIKKIEL